MQSRLYRKIRCRTERSISDFLPENHTEIVVIGRSGRRTDTSTQSTSPSLHGPFFIGCQLLTNHNDFHALKLGFS
ncbi:hypothetical protein HanXRQr2_Chr14g0641641 [Helianthus annuus]|uniref:Uncharacterized protein n=1 Tax=Helianthus annuus TaxID=4232 RepID=A0A9K3E8J7_HELAN|nr:hypothetical protein HanXRQr2_Chr14g0641641 [Helianthus annuus]